ncbi:MAG: glycosyltransferase family 25 protein [Rhodobacteraceae bacterium]|nr:glycosyltransferase family 25 protein [Paracoccaceae bacterium]
MKALVLNLADAGERLSFISEQLKLLSMAWDRIEAVSPHALEPSAEDPVWQRWERPLRTTEMATCASHMIAWAHVFNSGEPHLVLEDDAMLDKATPKLLEMLEDSESGFDHVSLETALRKKLLALNKHPDLPVKRMYLDRTGAAAYALWPSGATKLLARACRARGLADGIICAASELNSWQADPALAVQLNNLKTQHIVPMTAASSQITAEAKPQRGGIYFRARRIRSQATQGLRQLRPGARLQRVDFSGDWVINPLRPS